jgi:hypothetical protein
VSRLGTAGTLALAFATAVPCTGVAQGLGPLVPITVPYSGHLTAIDGTPVTGSVSLTFALYTQAAATTTLWSEAHHLSVSNGYFSVVLGDAAAGGTPFPPGVWNGAPRYLGVTVGSDPEMTPRLSVASVPYALLANPTPHALTHAGNGSDALGSTRPTPNELPRAGTTGTIDPGWLPAAGAAAGGTVTLYSASNPGGAVQGTDARLSDARAPLAHAATHRSGGTDEIASATPSPNAIPKADANGTLVSFIPRLPVANGGTGSGAPRTTRNLCFYLAGPSPASLSTTPTLQVPPDLTACTAIAAYGSSASPPSGTVAWNIGKLPGPANLFATNAAWSASQSSSGSATGGAAVSGGDVLAPVFASGSVINATVCVQLQCALTF